MSEKTTEGGFTLDSPDVLKLFKPDSFVNKDDEIQAELNLRFENNGRVDTLRNSVLSFLSVGRYDTAIRELSIYQKNKSGNSSYQKATEPLFRHAIEMAQAMKKMTQDQDLKSLPRAKRQDTLGRIRRLFENMKQVLVRLEQIENDLLVQDARSVIWFIRSCSISMFSVIAFVAFVQAVTTLGRPMEVTAIEISNWIFRVVGF